MCHRPLMQVRGTRLATSSLASVCFAVRTSTVVIAAAVAVGSVLLAWATMPSRPGVASRIQPAETFALGFDIPSVGSITVTSAGETATLTHEGLEWTLTLPTVVQGDTTTWPANPEAVRVLTNELATQSIEVATGADRGPAPDDPLATITIDLPAGPTTIAVTAAPIGGRLPVRITDPSGTRLGFVAANRFRPTDVGQLAALADPKPFNTAGGAGGVITRVALTPRAGEGFAISRVGGIWQLDEDFTSRPPPRLHQTTVRAMLDDLRAIRAASVIVPAEIPANRQPTDQPIDDPFLTIETTADLPRAAGEPRRQTSAMLTVDDQATVDGLTNAIATRSGDDRTHALQVRLDPQAFPALPADVRSLLDPVPLPWDAGDTIDMMISRHDTDRYTRARRTLDGWMAVTLNDDPAGPANSAAIQAVLAVLSKGWPSVARAQPPRSTPFDAWIRLMSLSAGQSITLGFEERGGELVISDGSAVWTASSTSPDSDAAAFIAATQDLLDPATTLTP